MMTMSQAYAVAWEALLHSAATHLGTLRVALTAVRELCRELGMRIDALAPAPDAAARVVEAAFAGAPGGWVIRLLLG
jgi:hypothetical protein